MTSKKNSDCTIPSVSVIVPVYNDPEGIQTTLDSLTKQTYDEFEVIVVDNNSTDETETVLNTLVTKHPELIEQHEETNVQSSYAARNTGIQYAEGDLLLFLDSDMWVGESWIHEMVTAVESNDYDYLGCNVEIVMSSQPSIWEQYQRALSFPVKTYLEGKNFVPTCALAVKMEVFDKMGLFDHRLESGGDKEFGQRVQRAGYKQGYTGSTTAYHPARSTFAELRSKAQRIGRGRAQMRYYNSDTTEYVHPLHPIRVLPPNPYRLYKEYSKKSTSVSEIFVFYVLEYILKLIQTISSVRESISVRNSI